MATNAELDFEWSLLCDDDSENVTEKHLQLAAELGKTLLERNKELEATIKQHQLTIDDQTQEIEYLTKQNNALREVNDTRLKIYENIEISIQDLEKQNHRLNVDNSNVKKINKTLTTTNESLEERLEELRKQIEELNREVEIERRKNERLQVEQRNRNDETVSAKTSICSNGPDPNQHLKIQSSSAPIPAQNNIQQSIGYDEVDRLAETCDNEEIVTIITELDGTKRQLAAERQRISELEDQLSSLIQDNRELQNRITQNAENFGENEMRSMHEELAILEESGQGKMCRRCLRGFDDDALTVPDYASSIACTDDGDDASLSELIPRANSVQNIYHTPGSSSTNQGVSSADSTLDLSSSSPNPYRDLVEKYEALLDVHNSAFNRNHSGDTTPVGSLQDELASSGCVSMAANKQTNASETGKIDDDSEGTASVKSGARRKLCIRTPTDFSEAETSSSGFSDEISTKCTQTEETFLCTIADGEDKFSIYDEAQPIDARFRHCPKYRHLFKEIFATLKKAAENKDEGEKLPLLDDTNPAFKVPPVTPAAEELPNFPDVETESVVSSVVSEQSIAMSECVTKHERKTAKKNLGKTGQENKPPTKREAFENGHMPTPHKREPLEYYALNNLRKKNKKRNRQPTDSADVPAVIPTSPRFFYANRKRRDRTAYEFSRPSGSQQNEASGSGGRNNENVPGETVVYRTKSAAGHDLHKLMKLDLSYAEVLRRADQSNKHHRRK